MKWPRRKPPMPIKDAMRVQVAPGDVVVVRSDIQMTNAQVDGLREYVESVLPKGVKCLVLDAPVDMSVVLSAVESVNLTEREIQQAIAGDQRLSP